LSRAPRTILGLDPGLARLGYGVLRLDDDVLSHVAHGCIVTHPTQPTPARLRTLFARVGALTTEFAVTDVAVEALFFSRNVTTAIAVGQARGVALAAAVAEGTAFAEYTPAEVKEVVAGFGAAKKRAMQQMVRLLLHLSEDPTPDDAADALAVAICHARRSHLDQVVAKSLVGAG
jgi:crossover junction endodeoxyribonuclease RuvC